MSHCHMNCPVADGLNNDICPRLPLVTPSNHEMPGFFKSEHGRKAETTSKILSSQESFVMMDVRHL